MLRISDFDQSPKEIEKKVPTPQEVGQVAQYLKNPKTGYINGKPVLMSENRAVDVTDIKVSKNPRTGTYDMWGRYTMYYKKNGGWVSGTTGTGPLLTSVSESIVRDYGETTVPLRAMAGGGSAVDVREHGMDSWMYQTNIGRGQPTVSDDRYSINGSAFKKVGSSYVDPATNKPVYVKTARGVVPYKDLQKGIYWTDSETYVTYQKHDQDKIKVASPVGSNISVIGYNPFVQNTTSLDGWLKTNYVTPLTAAEKITQDNPLKTGETPISFLTKPLYDIGVSGSDWFEETVKPQREYLKTVGGTPASIGHGIIDIGAGVASITTLPRTAEVLTIGFSENLDIAPALAAAGVVTFKSQVEENPVRFSTQVIGSTILFGGVKSVANKGLGVIRTPGYSEPLLPRVMGDKISVYKIARGLPSDQRIVLTSGMQLKNLLRGVESTKTPMDFSKIQTLGKEYSGVVETSIKTEPSHVVYGRATELSQFTKKGWSNPRGLTSDVDLFVSNPESFAKGIATTLGSEFKIVEGNKSLIAKNIGGKEVHAIDVHSFPEGYPVGKQVVAEGVGYDVIRSPFRALPEKATDLIDVSGIRMEQGYIQAGRKLVASSGSLKSTTIGAKYPLLKNVPIVSKMKTDAFEFGPKAHRIKDPVDALYETSFLGSEYASQISSKNILSRTYGTYKLGKMERSWNAFRDFWGTESSKYAGGEEVAALIKTMKFGKPTDVPAISAGKISMFDNIGEVFTTDYKLPVRGGSPEIYGVKKPLLPISLVSSRVSSPSGSYNTKGLPGYDFNPVGGISPRIGGGITYKMRGVTPYKINNQPAYKIQTRVPYKVKTPVPYKVKDLPTYETQIPVPYKVKTPVTYRIPGLPTYKTPTPVPYNTHTPVPYKTPGLPIYKTPRMPSYKTYMQTVDIPEMRQNKKVLEMPKSKRDVKRKRSLNDSDFFQFGEVTPVWTPIVAVFGTGKKKAKKSMSVKFKKTGAKR